MPRPFSPPRSAGLVLVIAALGATPCAAQSIFQSLTGNALDPLPAAAAPAAAAPAAAPASGDAPDPDTVNWDALNDDGALPAEGATAPGPTAPSKPTWTAAPAKPLLAPSSIWNRSERPDGSAAVAVGTRLPTAFDTRVGVDVLSADRTRPDLPIAPDRLPQPASPSDRGSGAAWANVTFSSWPIGTAFEARVDPLQEQGKVGTTISHTVPVGESLALTVQNGYSVSETLAGSGITGAPAGPAARAWDSDGTARLNVLPTGTSLAAGAKKSSSEGVWLHSLSAEQKLSDHLSVTGAVSETTSGALDRSIKAGFKHSW
jgi:hypothetical protein